jgi:hypothetical protein
MERKMESRIRVENQCHGSGVASSNQDALSVSTFCSISQLFVVPPSLKSLDLEEVKKFMVNYKEYERKVIDRRFLRHPSHLVSKSVWNFIQQRTWKKYMGILDDLDTDQFLEALMSIYHANCGLGWMALVKRARMRGGRSLSALFTYNDDFQFYSMAAGKAYAPSKRNIVRLYVEGLSDQWMRRELSVRDFDELVDCQRYAWELIDLFSRTSHLCDRNVRVVEGDCEKMFCSTSLTDWSMSRPVCPSSDKVLERSSIVATKVGNEEHVEWNQKRIIVKELMDVQEDKLDIISRTSTPQTNFSSAIQSNDEFQKEVTTKDIDYQESNIFESNDREGVMAPINMEMNCEYHSSPLKAVVRGAERELLFAEQRAWIKDDLREECLRLVNDQVEEVSCNYHQNIVSLVDEVIMVVLVKLIFAIVIMNVWTYVLTKLSENLSVDMSVSKNFVQISESKAKLKQVVRGIISACCKQLDAKKRGYVEYFVEALG